MRICCRRSQSSKMSPYFITGNALNAISGRVAFALKVHGSRHRMQLGAGGGHQACQALHSGDCDLAAGGVNVLSPVTVVAASRARIVPVGRCKTFEHLSRTATCAAKAAESSCSSDAQRDGDRICAVIPGGGRDADGASSGLTVPNGGAQQRLIGTALARAGWTGGDVDYLEAHGTGTPLGNPSGGCRSRLRWLARHDQPLLIGSGEDQHRSHRIGFRGSGSDRGVVAAARCSAACTSTGVSAASVGLAAGAVMGQAIPWQANGRPRRAGVSLLRVHRHERPRADRGGTCANGTRRARSGGTRQSRAACQCAGAVRAVTGSAGGGGARSRPGCTPTRMPTSPTYASPLGRAVRIWRTSRRAVGFDRGAREGLTEWSSNRLRPGVLRGEHTNPPTTAWLFTGQAASILGWRANCSTLNRFSPKP